MIICIPPKTLSLPQKNKLEKKGVIIIECENPEKVKVINPEVTIDTNDYFLAALHALTSSHPVSKQEHFVNELYKRLLTNPS